MSVPRPTPRQFIGGTLGVIAVVLGVRIFSTRDDPARPPMIGPMQNGRGEYGRDRKHRDHDKKHRDRDHDKKKHKKKHRDDDDD